LFGGYGLAFPALALVVLALMTATLNVHIFRALSVAVVKIFSPYKIMKLV